MNTTSYACRGSVAAMMLTLLITGCDDSYERSDEPADTEVTMPTVTPTPAPAPTPAPTETTPTASPASDSPLDVASRVFSAGGATMQLPETWASVPVTSTLRSAKAQYKIGDDGSATIYVGSMGPAAANIDRWVSQINDPAEEPERREHQGPTFTVYEVIGTGTIMAMGAPPMENATLMGLVVTGGSEGDMYIKATGPAETMDAQREGWDGLIRSIIESGG